ncbi:unnamed protein product [Closterium sp. NIES-54]
MSLAKRAHFGQHKTTKALFDAVVTCYSSLAIAALGRLILPYLFPELSAFATVDDLITHLRTSDTRYRVALPAKFLDKNPPPMYITLFFIITRLPDSLRAVRDLLLALDPTYLTVDLLEKHLLAAETSIVAQDSPLPAPSYAEQTDSLTKRHEHASHPASPFRIVRTGRSIPLPRPPTIPCTHIMARRPSSVPLRVPLPSPPASSLAHSPDPKSDLVRAAIPTIIRLLATVVTDPSFESTTTSALVAELVDFAPTYRLDYTTSLVAESASDCSPSVGGECALSTNVLEDRQEEFECLAAVVPHLVAMLLAPEGDLDAPDIPTPRSYIEAITGPYSSQWQTAMDVEMASWKSIGTYVDALPPPGPNIVDG